MHAQRFAELLDTAPDCPAFDPVVLELPWRTAATRYIDSMSEGRFVLDHFGDAQESGAYTL